MLYDYELFSDLTLTFPALTKKIIKISGINAICILSTKIATNAKYIIKSSIDSDEFLRSVNNSNLLNWEYIKINGVSYEEITFEIPSLVFNAPNLLYIENTSTDNEIIKVSLRGNR